MYWALFRTGTSKRTYNGDTDTKQNNTISTHHFTELAVWSVGAGWATNALQHRKECGDGTLNLSWRMSITVALCWPWSYNNLGKNWGNLIFKQRIANQVHKAAIANNYERTTGFVRFVVFKTKKHALRRSSSDIRTSAVFHRRPCNIYQICVALDILHPCTNDFWFREIWTVMHQ